MKIDVDNRKIATIGLTNREVELMQLVVEEVIHRVNHTTYPTAVSKARDYELAEFARGIADGLR